MHELKWMHQQVRRGSASQPVSQKQRGAKCLVSPAIFLTTPRKKRKETKDGMYKKINGCSKVYDTEVNGSYSCLFFG